MPERIDDRTPGRRLWDRIGGPEVVMATPAVKAAFERVGREIEDEVERLTRDRDDAIQSRDTHKAWNHTAERERDAANVKVERLRAALSEAIHRMASVAGRMRLSNPPLTRTEVRRDSNYLAEKLPEFRAALDAARPEGERGSRERPRDPQVTLVSRDAYVTEAAKRLFDREGKHLVIDVDGTGNGLDLRLLDLERDLGISATERPRAALDAARQAVEPSAKTPQPMDEALLQRLASSTLPEGPCLACGLLGMFRVPDGYLCASHAAVFAAHLAPRIRRAWFALLSPLEQLPPGPPEPGPAEPPRPPRHRRYS